MYDLIESIKYIIPSIVVFFTAWLLLKEFFNNELKKREKEFTVEKIKISLPLRLQAYERIILFLERISPHHLIMRVFNPGLTVKEFHQLLIKAIREEFTHNLSQQLYVSSAAWEIVKNAREEMVRQVNTAAAQLKPEDKASDLSNLLLSMSLEEMATQKALEFVKNEARKNF